MAGTYSRLQHDLGIVDPSDSTNIVGLVCARDDKDQIIYQEFDEEYLAQQFFTGGASYVNTPPQRRILMSLSDVRSGFGQNIFDSGDPKRYFSSFGCDLSVKGRTMAGWNSTGISVASAVVTAPTIANADFELNASWTNGARASTAPHGGTYHWVVVTTDAYQDLAPTLPGAAVTFKCWVRAAPGGSGTGRKIGINDGVTTTWSSTTTSATYSQLSVAKTLATNSTELRLLLFGDSSDGYYDDASITVTTPFTLSGTPAAHATFNSAEYVAIGAHLVKLNGTGDGWSFVGQMPATITSLVPFQVSGTDYLLVFLGTSTAYEYMTTAEVFTVSTATDKTYQFGAWVNTTVDTLYANDGDNTVRSTTNPLNGGVAWSGQTIVGAAADAITHLQEKDGALLIDKEDMPYYLNSAGAVQKDLAPECVSGRATHSGKNSTLWLGEYYRPTGDQALLRIGTSNEWIQPAKYATTSADFSGQVEAVAGDEEWLYLVSDNSTKVEIFKGRLETIDGSTSQVWHPIHELTLAGCETAWISTVYKKRLWISSTSSANSLYYLPLPTKYGDIENDTNASFKTATYWETPYLHGDFPSDNKGWIKIVATLGHTYDADIYWQSQYKKLGDSSYTNIGNHKGTSTDRTHTLYLPVDGSGNDPVSSMMRFKLIAVTDDTAKTPILTNLLIEAVLYPPDGTGKIIACTIKNIKTMLTAKGGEPEKGSQTKTQELFDNIFAATYPFTIYDIEGTARTVKSMPLPSGTPRRYPIRKAGVEIDWYYNLILQTITTS